MSQTAALATLPEPVAILGSRAGWGNRTAGQTVAGWIGAGATYRDVEELISPGLARRHFRRHRRLCRLAPWTLEALERWPARRSRELRRARRSLPAGLEGMETWLGGFRSVVATNHRAALWVAALRRHRGLDLTLVGVLTDYSWGSGWCHLPWEDIHRVQAPVDPPPGIATDRWILGPIPTGVPRVPEPSSDSPRLLVTGGGWGLGPMLPAVRTALEIPDLPVDVACGENRGLRRRLERIAVDSGDRLRVHGPLPNLLPLMERATAVATKPGGVTLAEVHRLGRPILLLPGLPGMEEANGRYARRHLGALDFSHQNLLDLLALSRRNAS